MHIASFSRYVYLWHLPVFFVIAGYFLRPAKDKTFIINKAKRLLVSYYLTSLVLLILLCAKALFTEESVLEQFKKILFACFYAAGDEWKKPFYIPQIGAIWYLWALFLSLVICNHFLKKRYGPIFIVLISFAGWASYHYTKFWLPLSIQAGMLCSLYLLIGYWCKKKDLGPKDVPLSVFLLSFLLACIGIFFFKGFWLVHAYMGNG